MAAILSRISFSKKPNSKVYNMNPAVSGFSGKNSFDPDLELERNRRSSRASNTPAIKKLHHRSPKSSCNGYSGLASGRNKHKNDFCESGGFENQSVKVLENYAVCKTEETTHRINGCLKVADEMKNSSSRLLVNLHQQSEQITQTHQTAASIDHVLKRGEKLLGSLGGVFSRKWKPKKTRQIKGPVLTKEESFTRKGNHMEQRQKCNHMEQRQKLGSTHRIRSKPSSALERVELEKEKQDDALSELSNLLGKLKAMAVDMGSEIDRQNKALDHMHDDVDQLNIRVKGASLRARHLLRR